MAGLLSQNQDAGTRAPQAGAQGPETSSAAETPIAPGGLREASPEEQAQYDQFVDNGYNLIYDQKTLPKVLDALKAGDDPVQALGHTAATVVLQLENSAQQNGKQLDPDILYHGGIELLEDLADLSEKAGIHRYDEKETEAALYAALDNYRLYHQQKGDINQQWVQGDLGLLIQADEEGKLGKIFPGLEKRFGQGRQGEPPADQQQ